MDAKKEALTLKGQELRYQRTQFTKEYIGELVSTKEYFPSKEELLKILGIFWEKPCDMTRKACVAKVNIFMSGPQYQTVDIPDEVALWFEERIPLIIDSEWHIVFDYGKQLLSAYIFNAGNIQAKTRAVEFAILLFLSWKGRNKEDIQPILSKMIYGVIRKHPELYWASSVPEFLEYSLAHENRAIVERALKLICAADDTSFLTRVSDIGRRAEEARNKKEDYHTTNDFEERFAAAKARSVLQETVRHLLVRKAEEGSDIIDFQIAVAQALRKIGALNFLPRVMLNLPEKVSDSEANYPIGIKVEHEAENNPFSETGHMETVLESCRLVVTVNGSNFEKGGYYQEAHFSERFICVNPPYSVTNMACVGKMEGAARKTIRVRVIMWHTTENKDGKPCLEHVATLTRYIHRAK